ncbi:MAG: oligopeptide transporter, OPT family [Lachnospiraceae bacterium]|nr:oligopeptide transporter, OPT family [Lachnospiraceae bacterium]
MEENKFKPYVSADKNLPELTSTSIWLGVFLAVIFGGANAYLGLRVGMTVSASIPAAVVSMGVIRKVLKKDSILENNMVQTIGSAGESVAAGSIFTLPVLFLWAKEWVIEGPKFFEIAIISFIGGMLGIFFMVPLRKALIVKEHGILPYPEGQACAEVLIAGEQGGQKASTVFAGLGIAALFKFISDGLRVFPSRIHYEIIRFRGAGFGADILPALLGVGYICGAKISAYLFAGGILGWLVLIPLIVLFGENITLFPAEISVAELYASEGSFGIWSNYIKYIGAGAVACGGIISLIKTLPLILRTFVDAIKGFKDKIISEERTNRDIDIRIIVGGIAMIAVVMWILPIIPVNLFGVFLIIVFGFFFSTVSSRMVGLVGSSNNPVSGMTIATLLIASIALKSGGNIGQNGMKAAIAIGGVICVITSMAGDTSQDLKTGYILGATPRKQQLGEIIGVLAASIAIGGILYLLDMAWGYGSDELPAPQATLMKLIVEGVMGGNLPWSLVGIGAFIAIVIEILGIPVLPFAIGLYLPVHLSVPMIMGGAIRWLVTNKKSINNKDEAVENGILFSSGLIAGEGIIGILLAVFEIIPSKNGNTLGDIITTFIPKKFPYIAAGNIPNIIGIVVFVILVYVLYRFCVRNIER